MTSTNESSWLLPEARRALNMARVSMGVPDYVAVTQQAQMCVEYSARAVALCFGGVSWGHSHSRDLNQGLHRYGREVRATLGREMVDEVRRLAQDDHEMAPWHTQVVYGRRDPDDTMHPPSEICTRAIAERSLMLAERSLTTAERFLNAWNAPAT